MNEIIKLVIKYQIKREDEIYEKILNNFINNINSYLNKTCKEDIEDVYQEMLYGLYKVINNFKINKLDDYSKSHQELYKNIYYNNFIDTNKTDNKNKTLYEFNLFCNENQFICYINKRFKSIYINYCKNKQKEIKSISLNNYDLLENEYIDILIDSSNINKQSIIDVIDLSKDDEEFLYNFIENGQVLSEKEVGKKLGISQQAVHKRKKIIQEKYKR